MAGTLALEKLLQPGLLLAADLLDEVLRAVGVDRRYRVALGLGAPRGGGMKQTTHQISQPG